MEFKVLGFGRKDLRLLFEIYKKGGVTKKSQSTFLSSMGFYMSIWSLRDKGLIKESGYDNNRQKIWVLTEKGEKFIKLIEKIEGLL